MKNFCVTSRKLWIIKKEYLMRIIVEWISNLDHFRPIVIVILRGCVELIKFVCEQNPNLAVSFYIFYFMILSLLNN